MKWFRLYPEARTDAKLRSLRDSEHRVWFNLLCLAGEQKERGVIESPSAGLLALEVARGNQDLLERTLDKLAALNIVRQTGGTIVFVHFADRQYTHPSDRPQEVAKRVQKHRKQQRNDHVTGETGVTTPEQNRTEQSRADIPVGAQAPFDAAAKSFVSAPRNERVARLIDLAKAEGIPRSGIAATIVRDHGHGQRVVDVVRAARNAGGDPWEYMLGVLNDKRASKPGGQRVATHADLERARAYARGETDSVG